MYVVIKRDKYVGLKKILQLDFIDRSGPTIVWFNPKNHDRMNLFLMLLSKYVLVCNEGSEDSGYKIPQTPISYKTKLMRN
jgi:hypothetical protein